MAKVDFKQVIEEARKRTQELMEKKAQISILGSPLPTSLQVAKHVESEVITKDEWKDYKITINGQTFQPFYIEGVGELNYEQREGVKLFGLQGVSGCLIGPAGTGKTTTMKAIIRAMIMSGRVPILPADFEHKYLRSGLPGIYGGSFTRIATRNLKNNCPEDIQDNIHTIHRLLEYEPIFETVWDAEKQKERNIRLFKPTRTAIRPLPPELKVFILDESSMVGTTLHRNVVNAIRQGAQFIYIGDIAQLPPVMDDSILGYKLLELPTVELKHVYRHAGAIVNLATHIRLGNTIPAAKDILPYLAKVHKMPRKLAEDAISEWSKEEDGSKVTIHLWKNRLEGEVGQVRAIQNLNNFFTKEYENGNYKPNEHMILMPYNKAVGTIELNRYIAQHIGKKNNAVVYEVIAGYNKHYFAIGDKVFHEREESVIVAINKNGLYSGRLPQKEAVTLDRWGHNQAGNIAASPDEELDSIDNLLNLNVDEDDEERKNQASHVLVLKKLGEIEEDGEDAREYRCSTAAEINNLIFGYALTIHKAQGSQWQKVYCIFHNSHNRNLQRELLYTAITRAQKELYVICEPETFVQGVTSQHIVGNSLAEKAEYFKGKKLANDRRDQLFNSNTSNNGEEQ